MYYCTWLHYIRVYAADRNSEGASVVFGVCLLVCDQRRRETELAAAQGMGRGGEDVVVREMRGTEKHF